VRRFALIRLKAGDWVCPSNDCTVLWRFRRYEDGSYHGLDVDYERRDFWMVERASLAEAERALARDDEPEWLTWDTMLPTRKAAIDSVFKEDS